MKSVIITGATSMLGIATIRECIKSGVKVIALSRPDSRRKKYLPKSELVTLIECDLGELAKINLPEEHYDVFYHFGWCFTEGKDRDDPILQSRNIEYTLNAVYLAYRYGCQKFLGAGSQAEYGFYDKVITEDTPVKPEICYGFTKYAAGKLAGKLCEQLGIICIWTRIFSVYGKYDGENTMIQYAFRQHKNNKIAQFSSGAQMWDYLFEEDAGKYFFLLSEKVDKSILVNVASGDVKPLRKYIEDIASVISEMDADKPFQYKLESSDIKPRNGIFPDVSRLRSLTGYVPQIDFIERIKEIWRYLQ